MTDIDFVTYESLGLHDLDSETASSCYQFPCKHPRDDESIYPPGSEEYKKARKRRQNKESAVRIRAKKKMNECHIFATLEVLKSSTGGLKVENAKLKSENELLRRQIELYKKLALPKPIEEGKEENAEVEKISLLDKVEKTKEGVKGRKAAGVGLTVALIGIFAIMRVEEVQPVNTGGRNLNFYEEGLSLKPIVVTFLVIICVFLMHFMLSKS